MIAKTKQVTPLMTIGQIAQQLDQPLHRINYVINSRNIREAARAGRLRVELRGNSGGRHDLSNRRGAQLGSVLFIETGEGEENGTPFLLLA